MRLLIQENKSLAELLASLPESEQRQVLEDLTDTQATALLYDWKFWGRPKQLPPQGDWSTWIVRAGRGFGKTRTGTHWFHDRAMDVPGRWMALIARTPADARDYCIEGPGGLLKNVHPDERPHYEPSKRRLTWPNESWATIYSDEEPDQMRGFSGDTAWMDEFGKYRHPRECWDNLQFGMREASTDRPRTLITMTPKPLTIIREIEAMPGTVVVTGSSYENRANLDPTWFTQTLARYEGTRLGRQEIHAEILDDVPGALWQRNWIEQLRVLKVPGELIRVVVAIDPATTSGENSNETGIVVAGKALCRCKGTREEHGFVLADRSARTTPNGWAKRAVGAFGEFMADRIIGEVNNGGDMVESTLRTVDKNIPYEAVTASRGKTKRAEPIASLYEGGKVHHVGTFPDLEDQMCNYVPEEYDGSPDRMDALVWALTALFPTEGTNRGILSAYAGTRK